MEITLTKDQLKEYIESLDLSNKSISNTIGNLQLLEPSLVLEVFQFLIAGRIDIKELINIPISNRSIRLLVKSKDVNDNTNKFIKYRETINNLETYKNFISELKSGGISRIKQEILASNRLSHNVGIDPLGLDPNKYESVNEVKVLYNNILNTNQELNTLKTRIYDNLEVLRNEININLKFLTDHIFKCVSDYCCIHSLDTITLPQQFSKDSVLGFIRRQEYEFVLYHDHIKIKDEIIGRMVANFDNDTTKLGYESLERHFDFNNWKYLLEDETTIESNGKLFIEKFTELVVHDYVFMTKVYGDFIDNGTKILIENVYLKVLEHFNLLYTYLFELTKVCKYEIRKDIE